MKKINLFLVGAPKCGTTSLADSLSCFQEISMCRKKEPNFFNSDHKNFFDCNSINEYLNLYNFNDESIYYLDASTVYLRSKDAIPNILDYNPNSKFIICYRKNLVEMFVSVYNQLYKSQQIKIPISKIQDINDIKMLKEICNICNLSEQIHKLLRDVENKSSILFISIDELDNEKIMDLKISNFLNVKKGQYVRKNSNKGVDYLRVKSIPTLVKNFNKIKLIIGLKHFSFGFAKYLNKINRKPGKSRVARPLIIQINSILKSKQIMFDDVVKKNFYI